VLWAVFDERNGSPRASHREPFLFDFPQCQPQQLHSNATLQISFVEKHPNSLKARSDRRFYHSLHLRVHHLASLTPLGPRELVSPPSFVIILQRNQTPSCSPNCTAPQALSTSSQYALGHETRRLVLNSVCACQQTLPFARTSCNTTRHISLQSSYTPHALDCLLESHRSCLSTCGWATLAFWKNLPLPVSGIDVTA
jgi:hypothetical protein